VLTHASIVCGGMLASVNSVKNWIPMFMIEVQLKRHNFG